MINIAICDDESNEIERVNNLLIRYIHEHPQYEIAIHSYYAPLELLSYAEEHGSFDVLLLDIYMAGILGTDAARALRSLGYETEIIFLTTSRDHSLEAFELDAAQYLVKPYTDASFFAALDKVLKRRSTERRTILTLKTSQGITALAPRDVVFTQTIRNNYQSIHTVAGNILEVRMTSTELFNLLSSNIFFIRCGASLNLNLKYVRQISKDTITLDTGERLSYPYRLYPALKEAFLSFHMDNT